MIRLTGRNRGGGVLPMSERETTANRRAARARRRPAGARLSGRDTRLGPQRRGGLSSGGLTVGAAGAGVK